MRQKTSSWPRWCESSTSGRSAFGLFHLPRRTTTAVFSSSMKPFLPPSATTILRERRAQCGRTSRRSAEASHVIFRGPLVLYLQPARQFAESSLFAELIFQEWSVPSNRLRSTCRAPYPPLKETGIRLYERIRCVHAWLLRTYQGRAGGWRQKWHDADHARSRTAPVR